MSAALERAFALGAVQALRHRADTLRARPARDAAERTHILRIAEDFSTIADAIDQEFAADVGRECRPGNTPVKLKQSKDGVII